jgi:hypothetical protein
MKFQLRVLLCGLVLQAGLLVCHAHDNITIHPVVSDSAAQSSYGLQSFLFNCFDSSDLSQAPLACSVMDGAKSPLEWIKDVKGS